MCQNQKALFAKMQSQLVYVLQLVKELKSDFNLIHKIKRYYSQILNLTGVMEQTLGKIFTFDDYDFEETEVESDWDVDFEKRNYYQIVGIGQSETQNIDLSIQPNQVTEQVKLENQSDLNLENIKRGPYRSYKTHEKLKVVNLYRQGKSFAFISRLFKIPQKNIVRWCKNGVHRKLGAGRKIGDVQMENKLLEWMDECHFKGEELTGRTIRYAAVKYSTKKEFQASKGWLKNFVRRHNINQRYDII